MKLAPITVAFATGLILTLSAFAGQSHQDSALTIRVVSIPNRTVEHDLPPKGMPNQGDKYTGTSILRNAAPQFGKPNGAVVGSDTYAITITSEQWATVKVQAKLPGGTVRVQGRTSLLLPSIKVPVTGGTGRYAGARGSSTATDLSDGRSLNVYRLRLP